jgi:aspartyl-tRNA(Asn)/glutamyl-tRNA(Gln) amidotransferase subunit A
VTGIVELAEALRRGETTATALATQALERLDTVGRDLGAVVRLTPERALDEAAKADGERDKGLDRGPLHGIPYGAKDLIAASGYPTTWGAAPFKEQYLDDAAVVHRLKEAGAVLVAKLATVELAGGLGYNQPRAAFTGPMRSPRDRDTWAGGSSGGSAAAVGAGCVPFALGTETVGSILQPAAYSGVVGVRPTYGCVDLDGVMSLTWTMDKLGVFGMQVADCATVLQALTDRPFSPARFPDRPLRLAFLALGVAGAQSGVRESYLSSLEACSSLGSLTELELGDWPWDEVTSLIVRAETGATFGAFIASGGASLLAAPETAVNAPDSLSIGADTYINAQRLRTRMCRDLANRLEPFDALLAPTMPFVATPIDEPFKAYYELDYDISLIMAGNLAGLPAVAIPNGIGQAGLPTSLCVVGRAHDDGSLLQIAAAIQNLLPCTRAVREFKVS